MTDERHDENGRTQALTERVLRRLRGDDRRSHSPAFIAVALSALGSLGGLGLFAMDLGAQKQRIDTIEKRQVEDRVTTGENVKRLDAKVERIDGNVNLILQELRAMQAEQRAERRAPRRGE